MAAQPKMPAKQRMVKKDALAAALDDVYKDEEDEKPDKTGAARTASDNKASDSTVVHGHELKGGVDPSFAAALHDKLVDEGGNSEVEPSGLRAPCSTVKLSAEELARMDDEDDDQPIHVHTQGAIDQIDSKLVTELQRKLGEEDQGVKSNKDDFATALSKGLASAVQTQPQDHGKIDHIDDALVMNLQKKLGGFDTQADEEYFDPEVEAKSGLRAPQPTVKLSAQDMLAMEDEEEENVAGVVLDTKSHGAIDLVNSALVTQLQSKLADQTDDVEAAGPSGFRAPANTQKITADMMNALDDDDEEESAPMPGMGAGVDPNLVVALKRKLEDDAELESEKDPKKIVKATGEPTVKLSADMLADLEAADEEDEKEELHKAEMLKEALKQAPGARGSEKLDPSFAASLAKGLEQAAGGAGASTAKTARVDTTTRSSGGFDADMAAKLYHGLAEAAGKGADEDDGGSGLRAPQCTEVITADMLAALDDDAAEDATGAEPEGQLCDAVSRLLGQEQTQESFAAVSGVASGAPKKKEKKKVNVGFRPSNSGGDPNAIMDALSQKLSGGADPPPAAKEADDTGQLPRAPANTLMLTEAQLAAMDDEEDAGVIDVSNLQGLEEVASGTKAPHTTALLTADMLNAVYDDDEPEEVTEVPQAGMKAPMNTMVLSSQMLDDCNDDADLMDANFDDVEDEGPISSGLKAPQTTAVLSGSQLAMLDADDEDDEGPAQGAVYNDDDEEDAPRSGLKAPHTTCMLRADDLAQLDDDVEEDTQESRTLAAELQPAEDIATQVVQRVRDMPEAITDPWGNLPTAPVNSSCKLRLAWLSKDEIRKENDNLRKEISKLRQEIDAHRKAASLSQKA